MNVLTIDRRTAARLIAQAPRVSRPKVIRRLITLPGASRMERAYLEPTRLGIPLGHKPIEVIDTPVASRWDSFIVVGAFLGLFFRLLGLRLTGRRTPTRTGRELRLVFERLGGLWMKVGQLMSLRRDVLPVELCDELAQLQHRAIGFSPAEAMGHIEQELGAPIEDLFSNFDPMPFAAASLSQVHAARLRDGDVDVVVKVLRPGVREKLERDMRILRFAAFRLSAFRRFRQVRLKDAVSEFEQIFREETDYRYELNNMQGMRKSMRGHKIYIPRPYPKYSTSSVIVMERISGVLMSDYIKACAVDPDRVDDWLQVNRIDPKKVGMRLLTSFMRQLFENNLFHADLHPGNIVLLRDSRAVLIDLGSVGTLDREFLILYRGIQRAMAEKDFGKAVDLQLRLCSHVPVRTMAELRSDLIRCMRTWSGKTKIAQLAFRDRSVNTGAAEVSQVMYRYGAEQTWEFLKIARTLSTLDASLEYLYPGLDYTKILKGYFKQASRRGIAQLIRKGTITRGIGSIASTLEEYHLLLGPVLRSSAFNFEAAISKMSRIGAIVTKVMAVGLLLTTLAFGYKYLKTHEQNMAEHVHNAFLDTIVDHFPQMEKGWSIIVILGSVIVLATAHRVVKELLKADRK